MADALLAYVRHDRGHPRARSLPVETPDPLTTALQVMRGADQIRLQAEGDPAASYPPPHGSAAHLSELPRVWRSCAAIPLEVGALFGIC
jgi:hypothetical protein